MKEGAQLQAVIDILQEVDAAEAPADAVIAGYFRAHRYIGSKDRAAISSQLYDLMRHYLRLTWWLKKLAAHADARHLVLAYLTLVKKMPAASIAALFSGGKYAPDTLSGNEQDMLGEMKGHSIMHPEMDEAVKFECPEWAYPSLKEELGERFEEEMRALQLPATLDLRINPIKTTREAVLKEFAKTKIAATPTPYAPHGLRIEGRPSLSATQAFKDGQFEFQDEGSQILAMLVDAKAGMSVVDFCAGAGGKTLAIAAGMNNKGRVMACDVVERRLERARLRFRRAGLHNIEVHVLDNEQDNWVKRNAGKHDRVLVDAPCSGTGTWRRNPDARWKRLGPKLDELLAMQARILQSAARLVKPGGRLVYATCSMLPQENRMQIEAFLEKNVDFRLVPLEVALAAHAPELAKGEMLQLTPSRHQTDGFFAATLERMVPEKAA